MSSTCAIFLSSSLMVLIMACFLRTSLSETGINAPFMSLLFQTTITRVMKKYHDQHDFRLIHGGIMLIFAVVAGLSVYFVIIALKTCRTENQRG